MKKSKKENKNKKFTIEVTEKGDILVTTKNIDTTLHIIDHV